DELTGMLPLFNDDVVPQSFDDVVDRYRTLFLKAVTAWKDDKPGDDDVRLVNWMLTNGLLKNDAAFQTAAPVIKELVLQYREVEARLQEPATVNGMADINAPVDYRLNVRGDYDQPGDPVPHGPLRLLVDICQNTEPTVGADFQTSGNAAQTASVKRDSMHDRLELAELVANPRNPLTARCMSIVSGTGCLEPGW
ncbi:MAG: hypothetical protein WKF77_31950, partial [Planctomycetaceae bacterium]